MMKKCSSCSYSDKDKMKKHKKEHKEKKKHNPKMKKMDKKEKKISKVLTEYKEGELHSGSKKGPEVTNPKQAVAIALSEAKKANKKKK